MSPSELAATPPLTVECPDCGIEALYKFENANVHPPDPGWICFHCGISYVWNELSECDRCERPIYSGSEFLCNQCLTELGMKKDTPDLS